MDERIEQVLFEIHKGLPREGPGDAASTRRAFAMLTDLPDRPRILDVGCDPGMQTCDLLDLSGGDVTAVDNHQPYLDTIERAGYRSAGHLWLPASSWWEHYDTPLEVKLPELRNRYRDQPDQPEVVEMHQSEIDLFRTHFDYYGYVFSVMRAD